MISQFYLLQVVLVNVQDHDDIFARFVVLNQHQVVLNLNDQTIEKECLKICVIIWNFS
jgi:prephenate dehydratase